MRCGPNYLMKSIDYTQLARTQLGEIKAYIAKESPSIAASHLRQIKQKIELLIDFPYLGRANTTFGIESIRDLVVLGYKIIYKIESDAIVVLTVYRYVDFDERRLRKYLDKW